MKSSEIIFHWSRTALITTVWISSILFGLHIFTFYANSLYQGDMAIWNEEGLSGLYDPEKNMATLGLGIHFFAGALIVILGTIQFIKRIRNQYPQVHRLIGRIYIIACLLTAVGGLTSIAVKGTIGGTSMDIGFSLYGITMLIAALLTFTHARARRQELHRAWAIRLYSLAIGSWLYRMYYGFWMTLADGAGHTNEFDGLFDVILSFFFYIPNLIIAEIIIRNRFFSKSSLIRITASTILTIATLFLSVGTYYVTVHHWGPPILKWLWS